MQIRGALTFWLEQLDEVTPLWVLTGLAAGADTWVAEVALQMKQESGGERIRVKACLPMPLEHYRQDFDGLDYAPDAGSRLNSLVETLKQQGEEVLVVPSHLSAEQQAFAFSDRGYGDERNTLYLNQSLFVAKYANVLLALWDGQPARGSGGTADAVAYKLGLPPQWPLGAANPALEPVSQFDGQMGGVVHQLPLVRVGGEPVVTPKFCALKSDVLKGELPAFGHLWVSQQDNGMGEGSCTEFLSAELMRLLTDINQYNALPVPDVANPYPAAGLEQTQSMFLRADGIALERQTRYRRTVQRFFISALLVLALYEIVSNFLDGDMGAWIFAGMLGGLLYCALLVKQAARNELKWKYQLARGIAEGMRIRGFLNLSGVPPKAAPLIPRRFRQHLPLLNHAIAIAELDWWRDPTAFSAEATRASWIEDQRNFLSARLSQEGVGKLKWSERFYKRPLYAAEVCQKWAKSLFNGSIVFALALFMVVVLQYVLGNPVFADSKDYLMLGLQYALMAAGAIALWSELAGYETTAEGYRSMDQLYQRADGLLSGEMNPAKEAMLTELAREAMFEHVTWHNAEAENDLKQKQQP
ncbi:hypothetical protein [Ferrimonas futtsuensis]|uniref:hypothetical protein n=1 Tax=Ferrimonas futtsuensis TaxID=364764 RepID=UPI000482B066|nr:hypothetical protein [Ferrimonas futtsuensis]